MIYVVLQKAKPYIRTRRGKLEHVRGYTSRRKLSYFKEHYGLRGVESEGPLEKTLNYLEKEFEVIKNKIQIEGDGKLKIAVSTAMIKKFDKMRKDEHFLDGAEAAAYYNPKNKTIYLNPKHYESFSHELGHFIFDTKFRNLKKIRLWRKGGEQTIVDIKWKGEPASLINYDFIEDDVRNYVAKINRMAVTVKEKAFAELQTKLFTEFYEHEDYVVTKPEFFDYIFNPSEIFARAVEGYVTGKSKFPTGIIEGRPAYIRIVNEWGDKYLKTGIVKSL